MSKFPLELYDPILYKYAKFELLKCVQPLPRWWMETNDDGMMWWRKNGMTDRGNTIWPRSFYDQSIKRRQKMKITSQGFDLYSLHNHLLVISTTYPKPVPYGNHISRHGNLKNQIKWIKH
jgi:hypothetical protein